LLVAGIDTRFKEILYDLAKEKNWDVQSLVVMPDRVHMLIAADPKWAPSEIMRFVKGRSSAYLRKEFPVLKTIVKKHLWTSSFYVGSVGNMNEDIVKNYINGQKKEMK